MGEIKTPILQQSEIPRGNFDPSTRAHIDPLTNDVRLPQPTTSTSKKIRSDPPILKFSLADCKFSVNFIFDILKIITLNKLVCSPYACYA